MNGFDFYVRVLKPWARDPAFYQSVWAEQSDTPAHEGTTHHGLVELWTYAYPLSRADEGKLAQAARHRPAAPRHRHAATSPATRTTSGSPAPARCAGRSRLSTRWRKRPPAAGARSGRRSARRARRRSPSSTGSTPRRPRRPALPASARRTTTGASRTSTSCRMTWDDEVSLLKRELARAHASLKLEEARNAGKPELARDPDAGGVPAPRQRGGHALPRVPEDARPLPDARQHGPGAARADRRVRAARDAELLRDRDPLRAAHALHALLSLVGPRAHARRAAPEPDPPRRPPLQHLGLRARRAWRPRWKSSCCTRGSSTTSRVRARSSGSCSRSARHAGSLRSTPRPTSSTCSRPRPSRSSGRRAAGCARTSTCSASSSSSTCASRATARAT